MKRISREVGCREEFEKHPEVAKSNPKRRLMIRSGVPISTTSLTTELISCALLREFCGHIQIRLGCRLQIWKGRATLVQDPMQKSTHKGDKSQARRSRFDPKKRRSIVSKSCSNLAPG